MANVAKALEHDLWMSCRPGAIIEVHPSHPIIPIRRASVSYDEWQTAWMYRSGYTPRSKETSTLVVPSVRWECAGVWTVVIGLYALAYMTWG